MNWFVIAQNDWKFYMDITRITKYVQYGKITLEQYQEITGQLYTM